MQLYLVISQFSGCPQSKNSIDYWDCSWNFALQVKQPSCSCSDHLFMYIFSSYFNENWEYNYCLLSSMISIIFNRSPWRSCSNDQRVLQRQWNRA